MRICNVFLACFEIKTIMLNKMRHECISDYPHNDYSHIIYIKCKHIKSIKVHARYYVILGFYEYERYCKKKRVKIFCEVETEKYL